MQPITRVQPSAADPRPASLVDKLRLLLGFAILPVVDALVAFLIHRVVWSNGPYDGAQWGDPVDAAIAFAVNAGIIAFIVTWTGVVPIVTWLLRQGRLSLKRLIVAGLALGNAPYAIGLAIVVLLYLVGRVSLADVGYTLWS